MANTKCKICKKIAFYDDLEEETVQFKLNPSKFCPFRGRHTIARKQAENELLDILGIYKNFISQLIDGEKNLDRFVPLDSPEWRQAQAIILAARQENPACAKCGSKTVKAGMMIRVGGKRQRYQCTMCGATVVPETKEIKAMTKSR